MAKTLNDFKARHDPTHQVLSPTTVFERPIPKSAKRFIITAAQNATPVHPVWWAVLTKAAELTGAELLVIPLRYKNPTSLWTGSQQNAEHWAAEVRPYLWNVRRALNDNLTVLGDIKTQPTKVDPLSGFDAISMASSGIYGHTKVHLRSIPTPSNRMAKILTTTGACTVPNFTDSGAGKIGDFHHSLAAVMVELDGKRFHLRQMGFDALSGTCTDLDTRYSATGKEPAPAPLALVMGDTHVDYICPMVEKATFGPGGMVDQLKPQRLIWHDLLDGYSCNPHHVGNPFNRVAKRSKGADDVRAEVDRAIEFVRERTPRGVKSFIISSNHNDFLHRWVKSNDWKTDPVNAEFYLETALAMVRGTRLTEKGTEYPDPFKHWFDRARIPNASVLDVDESLILADVALNMHGDRGPNGARGSIRNLRRIGVKSIIGHSHVPGIDEGCTQSGTSTRLRLEYNHGASGWLNAHVVLHADGKRQLLIMVDGRYRA